MIVAIVSSLYEPHAHGGAERVAQSVAETLVDGEDWQVSRGGISDGGREGEEGGPCRGSPCLSSSS